MLKFNRYNNVQSNSPKAPVSPTLSEKLVAFVDKFENTEDYPPAICNISPKPLDTKKHKLSIATIKEMPPNSSRQTRFHIAALYHDRNWIKFICQHATSEDLLKADIYGKTPLHYAAARELLGAMLIGKSNLENLLEVPDADGNTPLHLMANEQKFDRSFLTQVAPSKLKSLLLLKNLEDSTVLQIIELHGNKRLLNELDLLCRKQRN